MGVVGSGRVIALVGEAPKRFGVSEWENVEKAQCKLFDSRRPDGFGNAGDWVSQQPGSSRQPWSHGIATACGSIGGGDRAGRDDPRSAQKSVI